MNSKPLVKCEAMPTDNPGDDESPQQTIPIPLTKNSEPFMAPAEVSGSTIRHKDRFTLCC